MEFNRVPLAPLASVAAEALPGLVQRMAARIDSEPRPSANKLWTATFLLMGLRYSDELASQLLEGVQTMKESTTYQAILREGRVSEAQRLLLLQGEIRFGSPDGKTQGIIDAIRDVERLESLSRRVIDTNVHDWDDLLRAS